MVSVINSKEMSKLTKVFSAYKDIGLVMGGMSILPCLMMGEVAKDSVGTGDRWHDIKSYTMSYGIIVGGPVVTAAAWPVVVPTIAYTIMKED